MDIKVSISPDKDNLTGRECPNERCLGYFKVQFGTGIKEVLPCHCPYCGHTASQNHFYTKEQIEYVKSVALNKITSQFIRELKKLERKPDSNSMLSMGIEVNGNPHPIYFYREKKLEQIVICDKCGLRYAIYGIFGCCPDCGVHNSLQILNMNLAVVEKMIALAESVGINIARKLIENGLKDIVSAMDAFARESCKNASKVKKMNIDDVSFQNLNKAQKKLMDIFKINLNSVLNEKEWKKTNLLFQKRHLLAHKMGVADEQFVRETGENSNMIGKSIDVSKEEVSFFIITIKKLSEYLYNELNKP